MLGDAVPIRFSKRVHRQARVSPIRIPQKKIRRSPIKKRTSGVNTTLLKATKNAKVGENHKLKNNSKKDSKILTQAIHNLKPVIQKKSKKSIPKICNQKRQTRYSLNASQVNLTNNEKCLQNLTFELRAESENVIEKENHGKSADNENQSYRRSLRVCKSSRNLSLDLSEESKKGTTNKNLKKPANNKEKSDHRSSRMSKASPSPKGNGRLKELYDSDIKSLKGRKSSQKKSSVQVADMSSKSVLTPNPEKSICTSKHSERKKPTRLSADPPNQEASIHTPAFESPIETPLLRKVAHTSKHSENRKSARLSQELNRSRIMNSETSLCTSAFQSLIESSQPDKHSEKRKSSRLLESSPLRTLNKELSLSTSASLLRKNPDSTIKKSLKPVNSPKLLPLQTHVRKRGKCKISDKDICIISQEKLKQKRVRKVIRHQKSSNKSKKPSSNETENLPCDILATPVLKSVLKIRSISEKCLLKSSKRKLKALTSENLVANEKMLDAEKRKKSAGDHICVDNSTCSSKYRRMIKSFRPLKTGCIWSKMDDLTADLSKKQVLSMLRRNKILSEKERICLSTACKRKIKSTVNLKRKPVKKSIPFKLVTPLNINDTLLSSNNAVKPIGKKANDAKFKEKLQFQKRIKSLPLRNKNDCLSTIGKRKVKSTSKPVKRPATSVVPINANDILLINNSEETWKTPIKKKTFKKRGFNVVKEVTLASEIPIRKKLPENQSFNVINEDCLTTDLYKVKRRRIKSLPQKGGRKWVKVLSPIKLSQNGNQNTESSLIDNLTTNEVSSLPAGNELSSKISAKDDLKNMPGKGTLKRKRWVLENLREKNENYEDDIFENENFKHNSGFHFGDESDGSSVNIATPKFDCILTPALPKKTPRFKDCMSPTEFLLARKSAEEYLYRRNKKRKSGDKPSSSGKKTSANKRNITQDVPEKKKLDFDEAVNKLKRVQKDLEKEAEIEDEEEDSYFSDASN